MTPPRPWPAASQWLINHNQKPPTPSRMSSRPKAVAEALIQLQSFEKLPRRWNTSEPTTARARYSPPDRRTGP
eukprot:scaffold99437_cov43-Cyclotella_meneghiniana.AAC.4